MKRGISLKPLLEFPLNPNFAPACWTGRLETKQHQEFQHQAPLEVEIGFGNGEFLIRRAQENPKVNFLGIEQNWERICKALRSIETIQQSSLSELRNIRIVRLDARLFLENFLGEESIDYVYCLFPCPWPKKGHIKYRLFSKDFLRLLNNRLKKQGEVKVVTDFYPYVEWISKESEGTGFGLKIQKIAARYNTKFERKWSAQGQKEFFEINLRKKEHQVLPFKKGFSVKAYKIKTFVPERFQFEDRKGEAAVIFKEMLFDSLKQKAMIHLIVSEQNITQHVWIVIAKKGRFWGIHKADGQNILPTQGIALALESVYEAARKNSQGHEE